jgi:hypothetical protein
MGGWGGSCNNNNGGCVRDQGFASAFPTGLRIGDLSGPNGASGGYTALWTTSSAIQGYLPAGGPSGALKADLTNATSTPAGNIAGQLVAAKLTLALTTTPGTLHFVNSCVVAGLAGDTVDTVVSLADTAVATGTLPAGVSFTDLANALATFNLNYDNCSQNLGCLAP